MAAGGLVLPDTAPAPTPRNGRRPRDGGGGGKEGNIGIIDPISPSLSRCLNPPKKGNCGTAGDGRRINVLKKTEELSVLSANKRVFTGAVDPNGVTSSWPAVGYEQDICSFCFRRDIESYRQWKEPTKPKNCGSKSNLKPIKGGITRRFEPVSLTVLSACQSDILLKLELWDKLIHELTAFPSATPTVEPKSPLDLDSPASVAVDDGLYHSIYHDLECLINAPPLAPSSPARDSPPSESLPHVDDSLHSSEYMAALHSYAYDNGVDVSEASSEFDYILGWCF